MAQYKESEPDAVAIVIRKMVTEAMEQDRQRQWHECPHKSVRLLPGHKWLYECLECAIAFGMNPAHEPQHKVVHENQSQSQQTGDRGDDVHPGRAV